MNTPPHAPLTRYFEDESQRHRGVVELFDHAASDYNWICRMMSLGTGQWYRKDALQRHGLTSGMRMLDIATGTGLLAQAARDCSSPPRHLVGLDPSSGMLRQAAKTATGLVQGVGESLPFRDGEFDLVTMGYALRHVATLEAAFREYFRVLKPGGRVLLLEITRPRSRPGLWAARMYLRHIVPLLAHLGGQTAAAERLMQYHWDTIVECVSPPVIVDALDRCGFLNAHCAIVGGVFAEYAAVKPL